MSRVDLTHIPIVTPHLSDHPMNTATSNHSFQISSVLSLQSSKQDFQTSFWKKAIVVIGMITIGCLIPYISKLCKMIKSLFFDSSPTQPLNPSDKNVSTKRSEPTVRAKSEKKSAPPTEQYPLRIIAEQLPGNRFALHFKDERYLILDRFKRYFNDQLKPIKDKDAFIQVFNECKAYMDAIGDLELFFVNAYNVAMRGASQEWINWANEIEWVDQVFEKVGQGPSVLC